MTETIGAAASRSLAARLRAGWISLIASTLILAAKWVAWGQTGSQVVFSDAMESIVNVIAAGFMLFAIKLASEPADSNHPYGHGKVEFITGAFEGGLVSFAALVIVYESMAALIDGSAPQAFGVGMVVVGAAGVANLALGAFLVREGKRHNSHALTADGQHVLSDFWTSAGAVVGLFIVQMTGIIWLDAVLAMAVAVYLLRTGYLLIRESTRALMDELDTELVGEIADALEAARTEGVIEVHDLRAINLGTSHHVDLHVVIPEFWTVDKAHDEMDAYEERVIEIVPGQGDLQFHVDPCERAYCARCDVAECAIRVQDFESRRQFTGESVVRGPRPIEPEAIHDDPTPRPSDAG